MNADAANPNLRLASDSAVELARQTWAVLSPVQRAVMMHNYRDGAPWEGDVYDQAQLDEADAALVAAGLLEDEHTCPWGRFVLEVGGAS